jgi:TorA maturation chaperone TorD
MSEDEAPGQTHPASEEDAARGHHYALIGRLFHEAPDSILLAQLCRADAESGGEGAPLEQAWRSLRDACGTAYPAVLKQEYDTLFVGVGKSEVTPYTSHYVRDTFPDRHLVRLRQRLEELGLGRRSAAFEVEDHISGVCDVMRILIEGARPLSEQQLFFKEFVYPGASAFCDAVVGAASASFYRRVARYARAFFDVERESFEMEDADASVSDENRSR